MSLAAMAHRRLSCTPFDKDQKMATAFMMTAMLNFWVHRSPQWQPCFAWHHCARLPEGSIEHS